MKQITRKISEMSLKAATRGVNTAAKASSSRAPKSTEGEDKKLSEFEINQKYALGKPTSQKEYLGKVGNIEVFCVIDAIKINGWKRLEKPGVENSREYLHRIQQELPAKMKTIAHLLPAGVSMEGMGVFDFSHSSAQDRHPHFNVKVFSHADLFSVETCLAEFHITTDPKLQSASDASMPSPEENLARFDRLREQDAAE